MKEFDQEVAPPRAVSEQRLDFSQSAWINLPPFGRLPWPAPRRLGLFRHGVHCACQSPSVIPAKVGIQHSSASWGLMGRPASRATTCLYDSIRMKSALKQARDLAVRADIDRVGGRHLREPGHRHDVTADRDNEL